MRFKNNKSVFSLVLTTFILSIIACGTANNLPNYTLQPVNEPTIEEVPTEFSDPNEQIFQEAIRKIEAELEYNETEIELDTRNFLFKTNPVGEGLFIYEPATRFYGVERYFIWVYFDGTLFVPNGATKGVTPNVLWPRDIDEESWTRTRLHPGIATELIEFLYEGKELLPYETPIPHQTENEEIKFGYTIEERKEIYKDIIRVEDRAVGEEKTADYYYSEVIDKYGLTYDQVKSIATEGTLSRWPMPPAP